MVEFEIEEQNGNQLLCYVSPNSFRQLLALEFSNNARIMNFNV